MLYLRYRKGGTMSGKGIAFEGILSNGVKYQIHESGGFSNKCDIAINIAGEFVTVVTISPKRNGNIEIIPMNLGRMTVKASEKDYNKPEIKLQSLNDDLPDLLSDVISTNENSTEKNPLKTSEE